MVAFSVQTNVSQLSQKKNLAELVKACVNKSVISQ